MARISVEQSALTDSRFDILGQLLGSGRYDAIGRMLLIWNECQERGQYWISEQAAGALLGNKSGGEFLLQCDLAELLPDGGMRIKGTEGRIEWLEKKRVAAKNNGKKGGRPITNQEPTLDTAGFPPETPPAPAPAPAPAVEALKTKNSPSGEGSVSPAVKKQEPEKKPPKPKYHPLTAYLPGQSGRSALEAAFPILAPDIGGLLLELDADHRATNPGGESFIAIDRWIRKKLGLLASQKRECWGRWKPITGGKQNAADELRFVKAPPGKYDRFVGTVINPDGRTASGNDGGSAGETWDDGSAKA